MKPRQRIKKKFLFNSTAKNEEKVLLHVHAGKNYASNPNVYYDEKKQSGPTCWYKTYNHLKPRYGKLFPECDERKNERIISNLRKMIVYASNLIAQRKEKLKTEYNGNIPSELKEEIELEFTQL